MENIAGAYRKLLEKAIKDDGCKFICQVHLLPQLMKEMSSTGTMLLPAEARDTLEALITDDQKFQCSGQGLKAVGYDFHCFPFNLTLTYEDSAYKIMAPWTALFERNDTRAFSAISIWVSQSNEGTLFYFRLDGHANVGDPLPPLPNIDEKESTEPGPQKGDHCSIS